MSAATAARRKEVKRRVVAFLDAYEASVRASEARAALPPGSSRAKVTTANARWMSAAEERDRCARELPGALHNELFSALIAAEREPDEPAS